MKLYQSFINHIRNLGEIKLAWFTSFNIDIYFIEKYILSALCEMEPSQLKSLKDYEVLNDLFQMNGLNIQSINVKFFYDYRANNSKDSKKTCVPLVPINPKNFSSGGEGKFTNGVFHPKIGLFINKKNEAFILATSANLSISGWSQNSECAIFKRINDKKNAQLITDFFCQISNESDHQDLIEINLKWQENLADIADWQFLSSFDSIGLIEKLVAKNEKLHVWSPYFSDDLPNIIRDHFGDVDLKIIPDIEGETKVKISENTLSTLRIMHNVQLYRDLFDFKLESKPFVHAKTWLTNQKLAIGSWNFTQAGLNIGRSNNNNIEAGIILNLNGDIYDSLINSIKLDELQNARGMSISELKDEREGILQTFSFLCQVNANWENFTYSISYIEEFHDKDYFLSLPGIKERMSIKSLFNHGISFLSGYKSLLKDRIFSVFETEESEKSIYIGIVNEINTIHRPAFGYDNLNDLFNAWLSGNHSKDYGTHKTLYDSAEETGEEISESVLADMSSDHTHGWFSMFLAMEKIRKKIEDVSSNEKEYKRLGYHMPGSILQIKEHILSLKETFKSNPNELSISEPFLWFIINEINFIFQQYNKKSASSGIEQFQIIPNITLRLRKGKKIYDQDKVNKWLDSIYLSNE